MSLLSKLGYCSGSITVALPQYMIQTYIWFYYLTVLYMNAYWLAAATTIWAVYNAFNDPLFGYLSDRTRTKWGRRIPWIAVFSAPLALSTFLIFGPPGNAEVLGDLYLFTWLTAALLLYDTCYTIVVLNWTALYPEMFTSNVERSQVSTIRQLFSVPGLLAGVAIPPLFASTIGWPSVGLAVGLVAALFALVSLTGSHESHEFQQPTLPPFKAMKHTLSNQSFLAFVAYNFQVEYIIAVASGALPFFADYVIHADIIPLFVALFVVGIPAFALWNRINVKRGPRTAAILSMAWLGLMPAGILFVNDFWSAVVVLSIAGLGIGGFMILPDILIAFTIDADELKTGVRREGSYYGFNAFIMRFAMVAQSWTYAVLLSLSGFDEHLLLQPESAVVAIKLLMSLVPLIAILLAIFFISKYPYHGQALAQLQMQISELHIQKKEQSGSYLDCDTPCAQNSDSAP
ncbi:MAG: hypothetical protein C4K49_07805 [Candidatus Thorarchaeota archaeon]|nr:MAG: hypothetical protein C4K49_07805 [Candidatus Thorarchaeota archaeon]